MVNAGAALRCSLFAFRISFRVSLAVSTSSLFLGRHLDVRGRSANGRPGKERKALVIQRF